MVSKADRNIARRYRVALSEYNDRRRMRLALAICTFIFLSSAVASCALASTSGGLDVAAQRHGPAGYTSQRSGVWNAGMVRPVHTIHYRFTEPVAPVPFLQVNPAVKPLDPEVLTLRQTVAAQEKKIEECKPKGVGWRGYALLGIVALFSAAVGFTLSKARFASWIQIPKSIL